MLLLAELASLPSGSAAQSPLRVSPSLTEPLGAESPAAVVSYRALVGAADARRLNAAVVDTSAYWVAAIDRAGHVIAARIPRPRGGQDFARPESPRPSAGLRQASSRALPGAFELAARLRAGGVAVIPPAAAAAAAYGSDGSFLDERPTILKVCGTVDRNDWRNDSYAISEDDFISYLARPDDSQILTVLLRQMRAPTSSSWVRVFATGIVAYHGSVQIVELPLSSFVRDLREAVEAHPVSRVSADRVS